MQLQATDALEQHIAHKAELKAQLKHQQQSSEQQTDALAASESSNTLKIQNLEAAAKASEAKYAEKLGVEQQRLIELQNKGLLNEANLVKEGQQQRGLLEQRVGSLMSELAELKAAKAEEAQQQQRKQDLSCKDKSDLEETNKTLQTRLTDQVFRAAELERLHQQQTDSRETAQTDNDLKLQSVEKELRDAEQQLVQQNGDLQYLSAQLSEARHSRLPQSRDYSPTAVARAKLDSASALRAAMSPCAGPEQRLQLQIALEDERDQLVCASSELTALLEDRESQLQEKAFELETVSEKLQTTEDAREDAVRAHDLLQAYTEKGEAASVAQTAACEAAVASANANERERNSMCADLEAQILTLSEVIDQKTQANSEQEIMLVSLAQELKQEIGNNAEAKTLIQELEGLVHDLEVHNAQIENNNGMMRNQLRAKASRLDIAVNAQSRIIELKRNFDQKAKKRNLINKDLS